MNRVDDITPIVRDWLHEPATLPTTGIERVARQVHRTRQQRSWLPRPPMLRNRPLVPAIVIAVLGGAALAGGALPMGGSPSPADAPLAFETVEVEPGVLRVVNDGVRDLARRLPHYAYSTYGFRVVAGPDGSVWMVEPEATGSARRRGFTALPDRGDFFQLGGLPHTMAVTDGPPDFRDLEVGPDGTLWAVGDDPRSDSPAVWRSIDGDMGGWQRVTAHGVAVELGADGTVWAVTEAGGSSPVERSGDGGDRWREVVVPWVPARQGSLGGLWVTDGGDAWLWYYDRGVISRFDGVAWHDIALPQEDSGGTSVDVGADGTVWFGRGSGFPAFARLSDSGWTSYDESDGVPVLWGTELPGLLRVAPDGSVWVNPIPEVAPGAECGGLQNFDGTTWTRYLQGTCVFAMDIAPDGTVWLRGGSLDLAQPWGSWVDPVETLIIPARP